MGQLDDEPELRAPRSVLATVLPTPRAKRTAILALAAIVVVVILGIALSRGKSDPAAPVAVATAKPAPRDVPPTPAPTPAPTKPAVAVAATKPTTPTTSIATKPAPTTTTPKPKPKRLRRAKPIVVDYDKQKPAPTPTRDDSLERARAAYAVGNQHLFSGETAAAIVAYHQALSLYPNYVAGYRGLGLAFSQQGDKAAAQKAFRTYLRLAPNAKDVALIKKRL